MAEHSLPASSAGNAAMHSGGVMWNEAWASVSSASMGSKPAAYPQTSGGTLSELAPTRPNTVSELRQYRCGHCLDVWRWLVQRPVCRFCRQGTSTCLWSLQSHQCLLPVPGKRTCLLCGRSDWRMYPIPDRQDGIDATHCLGFDHQPDGTPGIAQWE